MDPGIREKVLAAFVVLSLIPLLFLGSIAGYEMNLVGKRSVDESSMALSEQAEVHIQAIAGDKASYSNNFFVGIMSDTEMLQAYANDVFANRERFGSPAYPPQVYSQNLAPNLPVYGYKNVSAGVGGGAWADWDHKLPSSPYLNKSIVAEAAANPAVGAYVSAEMNSTMLLDKMLRLAYDKNSPNVVATWFVHTGGISTSYPWINWGYLLASGQKKPDWNESYESYFQAATPQRNARREAVWIEPYYDTVGNGWMVSCVAPVYSKQGFVGVIGIDVTLDVVVRAVLDVSLFQTGHAFLIDNGGNAIAHKDLVAAMAASKGDPVPITQLETGSDSFNAAIESMKSGQSAIQKVRYADGKDYYLAYAPVPSPGFSLGVVIPKEEVTKPVQDTQGEITSYTSSTVYIVIAVMVIAIAIAVVVGAVIATRIVKPIKQLTDLAGKIGTGEIDERVFMSGAVKVDDELTKRPDEIGDLAKSFEDMINTIREDIKKTPKSEIKIEIKDSVISRSFTDFGGPEERGPKSGTKPPAAAGGGVTDMGSGEDTGGKPVDTKAAMKKALQDELKKGKDDEEEPEVLQTEPAPPSGKGGSSGEPVETRPMVVEGNLIARDKVAPDVKDAGTPAAGAAAGPSISICPFCGKELKFRKAPKFCPYCKEEL